MHSLCLGNFYAPDHLHSEAFVAISECDPSLASFLQAPSPTKSNRPKSKSANDPDSPWGLACYLSDTMPRKWGVYLGLDLSEKRHASKYMKTLLEEHELSPQRVRDMVDAFVRKTGGRRLDYPVGRFWSMRRELETDTAPAPAKDYTGWMAPAQTSCKDYSGWLR